MKTPGVLKLYEQMFITAAKVLYLTNLKLKERCVLTSCANDPKR